MGRSSDCCVLWHEGMDVPREGRHYRERALGLIRRQRAFAGVPWWSATLSQRFRSALALILSLFEYLDQTSSFISDDGVSIPCSYTSFLAPLSSSKLYNEVRGCRERDKDPESHFETPYVVRLHNFHQLADPQPCFTFVHPTTGKRITHAQ